LSDVQKIHQEWVEWMFTTPDGNSHPLRGNHAAKRARTGQYLLAGTLPNIREITIPARSTVFIPIDNVICTRALGDPTPLVECAQRDIDGATGKISATLNGNDLPISRINPHTFRLNVTQRIEGTGNNRPGHHPVGETEAAADGYYAIFDLPSLPKGKDYHELEIKGRGISVIYRIKQ
jgi:hypothetical protein